MLVVEDGSGLATAESYISVADATTYHAGRGNAAWAALAVADPTLGTQEVALRVATDFMLGYFRLRWKGGRTRSTQALDWPRFGVKLNDFGAADQSFTYGGYGYIVPSTIVPIPVAQACAALALLSLQGDLSPVLLQGKLSEKIGPIEVHYDRFSNRLPQYTQVNALLAPYLDSSGISVRAVRS